MSEEKKTNDIIIDQMINELKAKLYPTYGQVTVLLTIHDPCSYPQQTVIDNIAAEIDDLVTQGGKAFYNIQQLDNKLKARSNFSRITQSPESLAEYILEIIGRECRWCPARLTTCLRDDKCITHIKSWLERESEVSNEKE